MKKIFLIFASILFLFIADSAYCAPHINGRNPGPLESVGVPLKTRLMQKALAQGFIAPPSYPATVRILMLRVDFQPDTDTLTTGNGTWTDPAYAFSGDSDYWVNKDKTAFISYFNEVSYGLLNIQVDISNSVYRLSGTLTNYGSESYAALENFIYQSITLADPDIDFSLYDAVLIVHAGAGEESDVNSDTTNDLWSLYYADYAISPNDSGSTPLVVDGVTINEAIIMPQTDVQDGEIIDPLGVYVHEFGHWLGLPDLYCTGGFLLCPDGVGVWSVMDYGLYNQSSTSDPYGSSPAHPDAWSKAFLGWVTPQAVSTTPDPGYKTLNDVETNKEILKVPASPTTPSQYYLLENRRLKGFDAGLPGQGLLIWLIDEDWINYYIASNSINNYKSHMGVKLIEADGDWALLHFGGDMGGPGDPYPGSTNNIAFTPITTPASKPYTGEAWAHVKEIPVSSDSMTFKVGFSPLTPLNLNATLGNTSVSLVWSPDTSGETVTYRIYKNGLFYIQAFTSSFVDTSVLLPSTYAVSALDSNGYESGYSNSVTISSLTPPAGGGTSESGSSGRCFIATAVYGSPMAEEVNSLRGFRDKYLMFNKPGRAFVAFYYKHSPPFANFIAQHQWARTLARWIITPVVYSINYPNAAMFFSVFAVSIIFVRKKYV